MCAFSDGHMIPCAYCLTKKRTEHTYSTIFHHLSTLSQCRLNIELKPVRFTCDFELAAINGFKNVFPHVNINACFFYYAQSLWRKVQEFGMSRLLMKIEDYNGDIGQNQRKQADSWFCAAVGLILILLRMVQSTWVEVRVPYIALSLSEIFVFE